MKPVEPIYTAGFFPALHDELRSLLLTLGRDDWHRNTAAGRWRVRDVVAHLIDGDLRRLSAYRDGHAVTPPAGIDSYGDLVGYLNELNRGWVEVSRRLSTGVLLDLLTLSGPMVSDLVDSLPPHGPALYPVAWAGETASENWFDIGREYTERWHHQMQIREAVGAPGLLERKWLQPLLDLSFRAIPWAYRDVDAPAGIAVVIEVTGDGGGEWSIVRGSSDWQLFKGRALNPAATAQFDPETAWRLLYNALPAADARGRVAVVGDRTLIEPLFGARSVMV